MQNEESDRETRAAERARKPRRAVPRKKFPGKAEKAREQDMMNMRAVNPSLNFRALSPVVRRMKRHTLH
uniref:Uncharacterized protein n=1 Tax=Pristionchus pacificus TaxID=54126 RepID=A0A2A6CIP6_PRIPA|eukprot:PDM77891.1 hypothetical protein PRIPAC_34758 [Pristionchus pacificus]